MTSQSFEQVLNTVQAQGSFTPAWKKFIKTKFFVQVQRASDDNPRDFSLHVARDPHDGAQSVLISEERERLNRGDGNATAALYGAEIVKMLAADAAILVALSDRAFKIATDRVAWLKAGVEAAQARAAAEKLAGAASAAAPAAPAAPPATPPAPAVTLAKTASPASPFVPTLQRIGGMLDVAALMPRSVGIPRAGLSFYVPGAWRESAHPKGLVFFDPDSGTKVEASAFLRPGVSMEQWLAMRSEQVRQDMPFMRQRGPAYRIDGDEWRGRIEGYATEYTGSFPGSGIESDCLVACIRIDGALASIVITAPSAVFDQGALLYKWLLGRVDLGAPVAPEPASPYERRGLVAGRQAETAAPGVFGVTMEGRLGRLRAMAYGFLTMLPLVLLGILMALVGAKSEYAMIVLAVAVAIMMIFSLRLLVLRMHDINLSGKWLWAPILLSGLAGAMQKPQLGIFVAGAFWLLVGVVLYLIPGSEAENKYGEPPGPNPGWVKVCAALCIALQVLALFGQSRNPGFSQSRAGKPAAAGYSFTFPDKSFSVTLPDEPREMPTPAHVKARLGDVTMRQFHLKDEQRTYLVQTIDYRDERNDPDMMLDMAAGKIVGQDGTVTLDTTLVVNGVDVREVRARDLSGSVRGGRLYLKGTRLTMILFEAPSQEGNEAAMDKYFKSLAVR